MELIAILFVIAIWDVSKSAVRNARQDYRRETGPKPKAKSGKGSGRDPDATARAHRARGWWLRELGSGFAVTRTGWHAGWLAHRAEADKSRLEREEARTLHAETRTGVQRHVAAFRQRHAEATRALEEQLEKQRQAGDQATGKEAVQSAADEVSRKRAEREERDHVRTVLGDPPLPADLVRPTPDPEVIDTPVRLHNAEDSAHLNPGEPRCEGCGGTGRNGDGTDACPVCRGWGSASVGPEFMAAAPARTVCNACGRKGSAADPVLIAPGGTTIHRSHAAEQHEAYADALKRQYPDDGEIDEAVMEADSEPINPTASPTTQGAPVTADTTEEPWWRGLSEEEYEAEFQRRAAKYPRYTPPGQRSSTNPSPTTNGASMSGDANYTTVLTTAQAQAQQADEDAANARRRRETAEQHAEEMQAAEVDGATLSSQMDLVDRLRASEQAANETVEHATALAGGLQQRHGGIKAAVDDAPIPQPAKREFYTGD